jgi:hypothetical protein
VAWNFVAVFDACVLYPAPIRDLLLRLAVTGLFRARWSERIHDEWIQARFCVTGRISSASSWTGPVS